MVEPSEGQFTFENITVKDDFGRMEMRNDGGDKYKGRKFEEHAEKTMQNFVFPT